MQKIITRGFGRSATSSGIITQGYGGFFKKISEVTSRVIKHGKVTAGKIKKEFDDILVRVTLLTVNDKIVDITGQEMGTAEKLAKPRVSFSLMRKRIVEVIRLSVKRLK